MVHVAPSQSIKEFSCLREEANFACGLVPIFKPYYTAIAAITGSSSPGHGFTQPKVVMEGLFFNVNGGYVYSAIHYTAKADHSRYIEGIVRGYRNTLLTGQNYGNLVQCETIDGKLVALLFPHLLIICPRCQITALTCLWRLPCLSAA